GYVCGADGGHGGIEVLEQLARHARGDFGAEAAHQLIFVGDDNPARAHDVRPNRLPVVRHDRAQIEHRDADVVLFRLVRGDERPLHERAPRHDDYVVPFAAQVGAAEGDHEVFAGVFAFVVRLAIQMLVLETDHRIVAADRAPLPGGGGDG